MLDAQHLIQMVDVEIDIGYCLRWDGYRYCVALLGGDGY